MARCHYCEDLETAKSIQANAIAVFEKLGCSNEIIQSCRNLDFGANAKMVKINMGSLGCGESPINQIMGYDRDLKELREILNEARTIIERKDNKKTQCWSLVFAAIAAVGTLIAIGLTIYYSK